MNPGMLPIFNYIRQNPKTLLARADKFSITERDFKKRLPNRDKVDIIFAA